MTTYTAIFERASDGAIWGWIPEMPGASGVGETIDDAEANLKAGLSIWIESEHDRGREIPQPSVVATRKVDIGR